MNYKARQKLAQQRAKAADMRRRLRILAGAAVVMFTGAFAEPAVAPTMFKVRSGDTFSGIAMRVTGSAREWNKLYDPQRSQLPDPNFILPGMRLQLVAEADGKRYLRVATPEQVAQARAEAKRLALEKKGLPAPQLAAAKPALPVIVAAPTPLPTPAPTVAKPSAAAPAPKATSALPLPAAAPAAVVATAKPAPAALEPAKPAPQAVVKTVPLTVAAAVPVPVPVPVPTTATPTASTTTAAAMTKPLPAPATATAQVAVPVPVPTPAQRMAAAPAASPVPGPVPVPVPVPVPAAVPGVAATKPAAAAAAPTLPVPTPAVVAAAGKGNTAAAPVAAPTTGPATVPVPLPPGLTATPSSAAPAVATTALAAAAMAPVAAQMSAKSGSANSPAQAAVAAADTLVIGVMPNINVNLVAAQYDNLRNYLERTTNQKVRIVVPATFKAYFEATMRGDYDLAIGAPHFARLAQMDARMTPLAMYEPRTNAQFITLVDGPMKSPRELKGKALVFSNPQSLVAMYGRQWLMQQSLEPGRDYDVKSARTDLGVGRMLLSGDAVAAVMSSNEFRALPQDEAARLKIVEVIARIPNFIVLAHPRLGAERTARIKAKLQAFLTDKNEGSAFARATGVSGIVDADENTLKELDPFVAATRRMMAPTL